MPVVCDELVSQHKVWRKMYAIVRKLAFYMLAWPETSVMVSYKSYDCETA